MISDTPKVDRAIDIDPLAKQLFCLYHSHQWLTCVAPIGEGYLGGLECLFQDGMLSATSCNRNNCDDTMADV
ncbi:hypothetical protein GJAV_G00160880 [Gymnothorax javanicus]|nr:hypothetical protein GJAV_G00160880 [Gymnothorax javanicus]